LSSSPEFGDIWIYSDFYELFYREFGLFKRFDTLSSSPEFGDIWIYSDFYELFIVSFPAISYGDLVFSVSLTWNQPPLH
jgi:hypothetical protein